MTKAENLLYIIEATIGKRGFDITKVVDTREYEEDPDTGKFKAIPGSGVLSMCQRCGKEHEIHYYVKDRETNKEYCVGGTCAVSSGYLDKKVHKSIVSGLKTKTAIEKKLEKIKQDIDDYHKAAKIVKQMEAPFMQTGYDGSKLVYYVGDAEYERKAGDPEMTSFLRNRMEKNLQADWRINRLRDYYKGPLLKELTKAEKTLKKRLSTATNKLDALLNKTD